MGSSVLTKYVVNMVEAVSKWVLVLTLSNPLEKQRVLRNIEVLISMGFKPVIVCPHEISIGGCICYKTNGEYGGISKNPFTRKLQLLLKSFNMVTASLIGGVLSNSYLVYYSRKILNIDTEMDSILNQFAFDLILIEEIELLPVGNNRKKKCRAKSVIDIRDFYWVVNTPFIGSKHSLRDLYRHIEYRVRHKINRRIYVSELKMTDEVLTVSNGHKLMIKDKLGLDATVIYSAATYYEIKPIMNEESNPIRIVYHGGAYRDRSIDQLMLAVEQSEIHVELHLYLTDPERGHVDELKTLGYAKTVFHSPVRYEQLVIEMNKYDVGIIYYPPYDSSLEHTLPNKFFEYIQSRLAVMAGPSPDLKQIITKYNIGVITESFDLMDLTRSIDSLSFGRIEKWKENSAKAAKELNFQSESEKLKIIFSTTN